MAIIHAIVTLNPLDNPNAGFRLKHLNRGTWLSYIIVI